MPGDNNSRTVSGNEAREGATSDCRLLLSVIVPARDESSSIGDLILKIKESLCRYSHEIIVIDDGSRDATGEIARVNGTIVISHPKNLGKGAAMKTGAANARGDIIVFLDSDGAHDPKDIPRLIAPTLEGKADLVIGSRALPESEVLVSPPTRRLSNILASFTISVIVSFILPTATLFGRLTRLRKAAEACQPAQSSRLRWIKTTDCTSGFRAIRRDAWQKLDLISQGFQIETEMVYEAARKGFVIAEAPISCNWNSEFSHLSILGDGLRTLQLLWGKLIGDVAGKQ